MADYNNNFSKNLVQIITLIISSLLIAGTMWIGKNLVDTSAQIQVLQTEVINIRSIMESGVSDRYYRKDAERDASKVEEQIRDIEARLRELEMRINQ